MKRLFIDMDGTLATFNQIDKIESLYEEGYFYNLKPYENVIKAVKDIIKENKEIDVYILSAYLSDSDYALKEKNAWLDKYLPEITKEKRLFLPCGENKKIIFLMELQIMIIYLMTILKTYLTLILQVLE